MTTPQPQQPVNDDLEALIDLLALDDDDEDLSLSQHTVKAFPNPNTQGRALNNETSASLEAVLSFNPPAAGFPGGGPHQSTPLPRSDSRQDNDDTLSSVFTNPTPFSPESLDQPLPTLPPIAPYIPAVRSLANIPKPPIPRGALTGAPPPGGFRIQSGISASSPDLLPVSPFLLSPAAVVDGRDASRSPFFVQGSTEVSPSGSPHLRMRSLSQLSQRATVDMLSMTAQLQPSRSEERTAMSLSTMRATEHLLEDLDRAKAELAAVQQECEQLRQIVRQADPVELADLDFEKPSSPARTNIRGRSSSPVDVSDPVESTTADVNADAGDDIDRMSGAQAKQKLRDILSYLSMPVSALRDVPPQSLNPQTPSVLLPSPMPQHSPTGRSSPMPSAMNSTSNPSSFADIRNALGFVQHVDELVWKRSLLGSLGITTASGGVYRRHVAPLDLLLRDGRAVHRKTSSLSGVEGGEKEGTAAAGKVGDEVDGTGVFDEVNVKALGERLAVWERAVRARPRR